MTATARMATKRPWGLAKPVRGPAAALGPLVQAGGVWLEYAVVRDVERTVRADIDAALAADLAAVAAEAHLERLRDDALLSESAILQQAATQVGCQAARDGEIDAALTALDALVAVSERLARGR